VTDLRQGSFESLVSRPDTHVVYALDGPGRTLLVLFGGIAGGVSMPVFEFFRLTSAMPGKKAFFRDPLRSWYQRGIPGIGDSAESIRDFLQSLIAQANADRVVMVGASAGGFAAILFGTWCNADAVIAFSPQTFIDRTNRELAGDDRWTEQIDALHAAVGPDVPDQDLLNVMPAANSQRQFAIHVSSDDHLDLIHARRVAHIPGVNVVEHERGGHRLVKTLRDRGILQPMLLEALQVS
jgi:predicted esterase YcpF (UPF0227 family)